MCGFLVRLWSISCFVCRECHVVRAAASLQCKRGIFKKKIIHLSHIRGPTTNAMTQSISMETFLFFLLQCTTTLVVMLSFRGVSVWHVGPDLRKKFRPKLLSHLHMADPEQCECWIVCFMKKKQLRKSFGQIKPVSGNSDDGWKFSEFACKCGCYFHISSLGLLFLTGFGRKIGPGLCLRLLVHPIAQ